MNSKHEPLTHAERAATASTDGDKARTVQTVTTTSPVPPDRRPEINVWQDALAILTWAAGYDRIERGPFEAQAWFETIRGLKIDDVRAAITTHYRESRYPVMPADVIHHIEEGT